MCKRPISRNLRQFPLALGLLISIALAAPAEATNGGGQQPRRLPPGAVALPGMATPHAPPAAQPGVPQPAPGFHAQPQQPAQQPGHFQPLPALAGQQHPAPNANNHAPAAAPAQPTQHYQPLPSTAFVHQPQHMPAAAPQRAPVVYTQLPPAPTQPGGPQGTFTYQSPGGHTMTYGQLPPETHPQGGAPPHVFTPAPGHPPPFNPHHR